MDRVIGPQHFIMGPEVRGLEEQVAEYWDAAGRPDLQPEFYPPRPGDVRRLLADATFARQMLDCQLRIDVQTGIRRTLEHLQRQGDVADLLSQIETRIGRWRRAESQEQRVKSTELNQIKSHREDRLSSK